MNTDSTNADDTASSEPAADSPTPNSSPELDDMVRSIHAIGERGSGRDANDAPDETSGEMSGEAGESNS